MGEGDVQVCRALQEGVEVHPWTPTCSFLHDVVQRRAEDARNGYWE